MKQLNSNSKEVDTFVKVKILPQFHDVVATVRRLMREYAPHAIEYITYGIPAWRVHNIIAVLSPTKKDITLAFSRGMEMEDRYGLLQGVGKVSKHLKFKEVKDIQKEVIHYYIKQAIDLDTKTMR